MGKRKVWVKFDPEKYGNQKLPKERKLVFVHGFLTKEKSESVTPFLAVGYLRFAAGDRNSPFFVVPAIGGEVKYWLDYIPQNINPPLWPGFCEKLPSPTKEKRNGHN